MKNAVVRFFAVALAALSVTGCVNESSLRTQQAKELRHLCQSFAARAEKPAALVAAIPRSPLGRFRIGTPTAAFPRPVDVVTGRCW